VKLYDPVATTSASGVTTTLVGTGTNRYPFSVNRAYPVADTYKAYPYATIGKLFFTIPGSGDYVCSASVVRKRVIATAGHCVSDGSGHYYTNWVFIPALNDGFAPFGSWIAASVTTTNNWHFGGGTVPNKQDVALIVLNDKAIDGALHPVSFVTGVLGFQYNATRPTTITQLGYPCNLDSCQKPIATYAELRSGPTNNFEWGTAQFGGASGGPEVQDFGQKPVGTPPQSQGGNIIVSVTSYTYDPTVMTDGGSILGAPGQFAGGTFGDLINKVCAQNVSNCQ
jgi:V8-like Glu-specific endopeptidase